MTTCLSQPIFDAPFESVDINFPINSSARDREKSRLSRSASLPHLHFQKNREACQEYSQIRTRFWACLFPSHLHIFLLMSPLLAHGWRTDPCQSETRVWWCLVDTSGKIRLFYAKHHSCTVIDFNTTRGSLEKKVTDHPFVGPYQPSRTSRAPARGLGVHCLWLATTSLVVSTLNCANLHIRRCVHPYLSDIDRGGSTRSEWRILISSRTSLGTVAVEILAMDHCCFK